MEESERQSRRFGRFFFPNQPPLCTETQFSAIARTLGPRLTRRGELVLLSRLSKTAIYFLLRRQIESEALAPSSMRDQCRSIERAAAKLLDILGEAMIGEQLPDADPVRTALLAAMEDSTRQWWTAARKNGRRLEGYDPNYPPIQFNPRDEDHKFLWFQSESRLRAVVDGIRTIREAAIAVGRQRGDAIAKGEGGRRNAANDAMADLLRSLFRIQVDLARRHKAIEPSIRRKEATTFLGPTLDFVRSCLDALKDRAPDFSMPTDGAIYDRFREWPSETNRQVIADSHK